MRCHGWQQSSAMTFAVSTNLGYFAIVAIVVLMYCLQLGEVGTWDAGGCGVFPCTVQCQGVVGEARHSSTVKIYFIELRI